MPMITIEFDDTAVADHEIQALEEAIQKIVSEVTNIDDVFVYGSSSRIKIKVAPIEVFIQMTASKIDKIDKLTNVIKSSFQSSFQR